MPPSFKGMMAKTLALKQANNSSVFHYLDQELRYLQLMQGCPYVVQCYGHTKIGHEHYVVMEAATHGDLMDMLEESAVQSYLNTQAGFGLLLRWMFEIASGIAHMHRVYIRHGDIKPANILVFDGLHVKLADFGFSKKGLSVAVDSLDVAETESTDCGISKASDTDFSTSQSLFSDGTSASVALSIGTCSQSQSIAMMTSRIGGTPGYMAPEQMQGYRPTLANDIYSFAVTCLHMINGTTPRSGVQRAILNATQVCRERYGDNGLELMSFLENCLSRMPLDRPNANECVTTLKQFLNKVEILEDDLTNLIPSVVSPYVI
jgi:serine/threonine protein kinase